MVNPAPGYSIGTPYGKRGQSWSCNANSSGGVHTGVDYPCPTGTRLVAAVAGTIRHRSYGSAFGSHQFAISPSAGQPFADGEVFYAHTRTRLPDGTEVQVGDFVAESGAEGNVTGPHLHYEYHPSTKGVWSCSVHADPAPTLSGGGTAPPPSSSGVHVTAHVYSNKCGYGEPSNGDASSDTIKELQHILNGTSLVGGQTLNISGVWDADTDEEVRLWQEQVCHDAPDPAGRAYLGPNQFAAMFPSPPYTRHDAGLPAGAAGNPSGPAPEPEPPAQGLPPAPALMCPGAVWDPVSNFPGLRPFTGAAKKITLHTTETPVKPNWEQQQSGIPHFTADLGTGEVWQHLPLDLAAYTLNGGDRSPNSDSGVNIQVEIIGYSAEAPRWPGAEYEELRSLLQWIGSNCGVPYAFPVPFAPAGQTARLPWAEWEPLSGILGHSMAPYNDHTDPGALDVARLQGGPPQEPPAPAGDVWAQVAEHFRAIADLLDPAAR